MTALTRSWWCLQVERGSVAAADEQEAVRLVRSRSALSLLVRR